MEQDYVALKNKIADISIYTKNGKIFQDSGCVAIDKNTNRILAIGNEAFEVKDKEILCDVEILVPFQCGYLIDYTVAEKMMKYFLKKNNLGKGIIKKKMAVVIPVEYDEIQKKAISDMMFQVGSGEVLIAEHAKIEGKYDQLYNTYPVIIEIGKENDKDYVIEMSKWFVEYAKKNGVDKEELMKIIECIGKR